MIRIHSDLSRVTAADLAGFFVGWPDPPSPETHLRLLEGSSHVVMAVEDDAPRVLGFAAALSDGVLSAYISHLEVLPERRGEGIGSRLVTELLARVGDLYMVDLICDDDVVPFYERLGLRRFGGMIRRNYATQSGLPAAP